MNLKLRCTIGGHEASPSIGSAMMDVSGLFVQMGTMSARNMGNNVALMT